MDFFFARDKYSRNTDYLNEKSFNFIDDNLRKLWMISAVLSINMGINGIDYELIIGITICILLSNAFA